MNVPAKQIASVLGGRKHLGCAITSHRDLEKLVGVGMPRPALDVLLSPLIKHSGQSVNELRHRIVPPATYKRSQKFNLQTSETIERIARLFAMALDAFGEEQAASAFMLNEHPELGDRSPFEAALTEIGGRAVEEVIERGLHGLPV
jgi:putative toxin-antitoxin system antitoxin component (TIGR02293 family)